MIGGSNSLSCNDISKVGRIFDMWDDGIAIVSPDGKFAYTNKNWKYLNENGVMDLEHFYFSICHHPNERPIIIKGINNVIDGRSDVFKLV